MRYLYIKLFFIVLFIAIFIREVKKKTIIISKELKKRKIIFTFWEPKEKMPGYLLLCIKTWKKYLPDYEIKILNYKSVKYYLGESIFSSSICPNMTIPIQVDAIRVALLKKFGGIWIDADTIILNRSFFEKLNNFELIMLGDVKTKIPNIGFIFAANNSYLIKNWLKSIIQKVKLYKKNIITNEKNFIYQTSFNESISWNYLGNGIINHLVRNITGNKFLLLDRKKMQAFPELIIFKHSSENMIQKYQRLYFQKGDPQLVLKLSKYIILLHNSWTPSKYKTMSEEDFLKQDILLSKLFTYILN